MVIHVIGIENTEDALHKGLVFFFIDMEVIQMGVIDPLEVSDFQCAAEIMYQTGDKFTHERVGLTEV